MGCISKKSKSIMANSTVFLADLKASHCTSTAGAAAKDDMLLLDAKATMMPVTVNVNLFATHMPNTSPALTYAACYNTSWILRSLCLFYYCKSDMYFAIITLCLDLLFIGPSLFSGKLNKATNFKRGIRKPSTKKVGDKPLLSVSIFVQEARNNVLLAVPALLYAIENYIRFTPRLLSLEGMSRWLKLDMDIVSAAILVDACMGRLLKAEREHLVSVVSAAINVRSAGDI
ncbi:LOW QUALITY PROTEIN: hypothetical protein HID58_070716 [Brassica napus]|uniref:VAN3-binding protein-like auxin canalisation domain-containing protein n=1 Tax=Brassica napus TaxID=3708 RepID=A0ABQ7YZK7_BRANA|nr:LOW QUALITY PROTEIN: hypothetical protein HID58_070716 [Brassica napus]